MGVAVLAVSGGRGQELIGLCFHDKCRSLRREKGKQRAVSGRKAEVPPGSGEGSDQIFEGPCFGQACYLPDVKPP